MREPLWMALCCLVAAWFIVGCTESSAGGADASKAPTALEVCHKLKAAGVASECEAGKPRKGDAGFVHFRVEGQDSKTKGGFVIQSQDEAAYVHELSEAVKGAGYSQHDRYIVAPQARIVVHMIGNEEIPVPKSASDIAKPLVESL